MRSRTIIAILATCALGLPTLAAEMPVTPYAGQQVRQVKALSDEDIAAHRKGEGMGMAKAAELNFYPGPAHFGELHLAENFDQLSGSDLISSPITRVVAGCSSDPRKQWINFSHSEDDRSHAD